MVKAKTDSISKPDNTKKVFDISHPGKTTPSATSRPVIVTNRPIMKDPMMSEGNAPTEAAENPQEGQALSHTASKIKIKPLSEAAADEEPTKETPKDSSGITIVSADDASADEATGVTDEPKPADTPPAEDETTKPDDASAGADTEEDSPAKQEDEAPKPANVTNDPGPTEPSTPPATNDAPAPPKSGDAAKPAIDTEAAEAEAKKQAERQAELEKIIESQKYALPINTVKKRRATRALLVSVLLLLVIGVAAADLAMDAGVLHVSGVKPVTHFFKK